MLCRAVSCPTNELLSAARRVLMYLSHHKQIGLRYVTVDDGELHGYSDSDWATRHSTSGYVFMYGQAAVSWSFKTQAAVALSSCEAEIVAASEATKETIYLRALFDELGLPSAGPTPLAMENMSAINLAYSPEHHARTKHIDRRHSFVRERVESLEITVPFVQSAKNMADFFTKPLSLRQFVPLRDLIMNIDR
eukprot:6207872-Pleurochrysis_carterae.AAC.1